MREITQKQDLSRSLEDYLVAIWSVIQEKQVARVKDIAAYRGVKPGSVSPAMAKLSQMGFIVYERREFIQLTSKGAKIASDLVYRKQLLEKFFEDVLKLPSPLAKEHACAIEHCFTEQSTQRLAGLIQFIQSNKSSDIFSSILPSNAPSRSELTIASMTPGQEGVIRLISAQGDLNYQLIEMGLLPDSKIHLVAMPDGVSLEYVVSLQGFEITLNLEQANAVVVSM